MPQMRLSGLHSPTFLPMRSGVVIGWILGSRAARDAYAMELKKREEKAARVAAKANLPPG